MSGWVGGGELDVRRGGLCLRDWRLFLGGCWGCRCRCGRGRFFWIEGDGEGGGVVVWWWSPTVIKPGPLGAAVAKKSRKRVGMWCSSLVMGGAFLPNA
ncbi:MAG: hypothetical protein P8J87_14960 [Verrucomicrobiales bacterium]|nr:hypothetical protein [Verrucomicrobiales bacterium]